MSGRRTTPGLRDHRYAQLMAILTARRQELCLSQRELADRIGIHRQFVSRVELGERRLDVAEFVDFARALELDPGQLIDEMPERSP